MYQQHYRLPDQPTGYRLEPYGKGLWSVLEPVASTNLIINPSYETALTGSTVFGGSETLTRDNTKQRYGNWSLKVVTSSSSQRGMILNNGSSISLIAGKTYTVSVEAFLAGGVPYRLYVTGPSSSTPGSLTITGQGRWVRYVLTFAPTVTGGHNINFIKDASTSVVPWWIDGWLLEDKPYATTYLDGDQRGYPEDYIDLNGLSKPSPYQWLGTPHASQSRRLETTRHGGREWTFDSLGLSVLAYTGAGIPPMNLQDVSHYFGGGSFQRKTKAIRNLTLLVAISASGLMSLDRQIAKAEQLLNNDDGHVTLQYQKSDLSPKVDIPVVYTAGLESNRDNLYQERTALDFKNYLPIAERGNLSTALNYSTNVTNANAILMRSTDGIWQSLGTGFSGVISGVVTQTKAIVQASDGSYYIGGNFATANGVTVNGITRYVNGTFTALGTGANGAVQSIVISPDGSLYAGGDFTTMGGVANTSRLAKWNGTTWSSIGTVTGGVVTDLAIAADGSLYATGNFTAISGIANTANVAKWNGTTWSSLGGVNPNSQVNEIVIDNQGNVYITGLFTQIGGVTHNYVARFNGSTWEALGLGFNSGGASLAIGQDGLLYAGGAFTTADLQSANSIARWNGSAWQPLGNGLTTPPSNPATVNTIFIAPNGDLYVEGSFTYAGTSPVPESYARWNGSTWLPLDVDLPGTSVIGTIGGGTDGSILVGFSTTGTAKSAVTTVMNYGSGDASPLVTFYGPGQLYQLYNYRNGSAVYFNNLIINDGEVLTLDLAQGNVSFTSNFRGNMLSYIGPGSNTATWLLNPGANNISSFMGGTTNANTAIYLQNNTTYNTVSETQ